MRTGRRRRVPRRRPNAARASGADWRRPVIGFADCLHRYSSLVKSAMRVHIGAIVPGRSYAMKIPDGLKVDLGAALLGSASDAIVATDRDGRITFWNPGAERLFGFTV